jgi:polyisoprenoid-binding protein YceI
LASAVHRRGTNPPFSCAAPWNSALAFSAKTAIDREDFGLACNQVLEAGGVLVGDRVEIELDVQVLKAADSQAA